MITSPQNRWVLEAKKLKQKKYREGGKRFLVEGLRLAEEAVKGGQILEAYYHDTLGGTQRGEALLKGLSATGCRFFQVSARVMEALSETEAPQGIVLVAEERIAGLKDLEKRAGDREGSSSQLLVVMDSVQDPGNLGAVLRTLWAAGGGGMICLKGTADPFGGKAARASMGGIFHVPVCVEQDWDQVARWALGRDYTVVAADIRDAVDYRLYSWPKKTLLCIGNEGRGLLSVNPRDIAARVMIPLAGGAESLNAAVAAGILIFEACR
ncbi:MAG: RNA methyltransferase [Peptococcaceae bacterium]|nr:RNA methyltransferase [Peptococcaceae bacterium]